jgi:predicted ATPase/DNA-binding XRE family transcriptional regulator
LAEVSFGEWLKRRRMGLGLTQGQLALKINCSTSALRKFESEERRPSAETVEQLADVFDVPSDERNSFLRFARGDWQSFVDNTENAPWRISNIDGKSNLPSLVSTFIGREKEQREILQLLKQNRLVTLAGTGGIGKTRLAIQVGHQLLRHYPQGVWLVPLDSLSDPLRVPHAIASVFDLQEGADRPVIDTLKDQLREKDLLLILDNCEHLLDACVQLATTLLTHCSKLRILTTSREILKMDGEATYFLPPLSLPEAGASAEEIGDYESIRLFVERAKLARSTFLLTSENSHTILDICRRVDGIPLAIEFTAARVNILSVEEISEQLQKSFAILASDNRKTLSRHQTLQTSMDWSWSLLAGSEKSFLQQLSVFVGGWTIEAAMAVCDGQVFKLTNALVKKSLIAMVQQSGRMTRYRFHEFVRQYAHEKLVKAGHQADIKARHLEYFLHLSEQAEVSLNGSMQMEWNERLNSERDNIRAALNFAEETNVEAGLSIAGRLWRFWEDYDLLEGEYWLARFLDNPQSVTYPRARAKALFAYGIISHLTLQKPVLRKSAEECLAIYRAVEDKPGEIDGLLLLGRYMWISQNFALADEFYQEALLIADELGDKWKRAFVLTHLAWLTKNLQQQTRYWSEAIELSRELGDWRGLVDQLEALGQTEVLHGDIASAQGHLNEALKFNKELKPKRGLGKILRTLSFIETYNGNYAKARSLLNDAINNAQELGHQMYYLANRAHLGHLSVRQGNFNEARSIFDETLKEYMKKGIEIWVVFSLEGIAGLFSRTDQHESAARLIGFADARRDSSDEPREPVRQADVDQVITAIVEKIGSSAFEVAYNSGRKMTLDQAVAFALDN